ncbi:MAG: DNA mismatch repair protein MutS, partial [Prevotella sp.]|nr:DNA mismatch repair protein MutS [Prevotella sp.]
MAAKEKGLTPMMKQFFAFKEKYPDAVLLFRCGDFYETYGEDAVVAARILGITLTRRNNGGNSGDTEMAGFPHHALDTYLPKLIRAGRRVAICDQLEDPKLTKTLVKRGVTELVTPGVAMTDTVLNHKENNFLAAIHFGKTACGVAFLDISTGEFLTGEGNYDYVDKLLGNFSPKEVLYCRERKADFERYFGSRRTAGNAFSVFELDDWVFTEQTARQKLLKHFGTHSLKGFGVEQLHNGIVASGAIMQYLELTQHAQIGHITHLQRIEEEKYVRLDKFTIRSLELVQPMQEGGRSLLEVIDRTITPMGGRLLHRWLVFPLKEEAAINRRLDVVEYFFREPSFRQLASEQLQRIGDLERIVSKVAVGRVSPREMVQLKNALQAIEPIKKSLSPDPSPKGEGRPEALLQLGKNLHLCEKLRNRIAREIQPDPPQVVAKGNVIATGCNAELDELRNISANGRKYLLQIQEREIQNTGISSLKVGYNNVFGYYLEVRNTYKDKVPQDWVRKQTLAQAERYITQDLKEYEEKILGAEEKILALEEHIFSELVVAAQEYITQIQQNAVLIAQLDALLSFAQVAEENRYVRPTIFDDDLLDIRQGRHPVIEQQLPVGEHYVPNDVQLDTEQQQIIIITGPNMAGKSALLRQTALIT